MRRETVKRMASWALALAVALSTANSTQAQDAQNPYPSMAPIEKYLMDRDAEIALARSAVLLVLEAGGWLRCRLGP
jgi:hypothetical protein